MVAHTIVWRIRHPKNTLLKENLSMAEDQIKRRAPPSTAATDTTVVLKWSSLFSATPNGLATDTMNTP